MTQYTDNSTVHLIGKWFVCGYLVVTPASPATHIKSESH